MNEQSHSSPVSWAEIQRRAWLAAGAPIRPDYRPEPRPTIAPASDARRWAPRPTTGAPIRIAGHAAVSSPRHDRSDESSIVPTLGYPRRATECVPTDYPTAADVALWSRPDDEPDHDAAADMLDDAHALLTGATTVVLRGRKSRGGIERPDLATSRARLADGAVIDLEAMADRILAAAGTDPSRPDVPRVDVDWMTLEDRWTMTARPDRVAWRGKVRTRVRTHGRARIGGAPATIAVTSRRYWPDAPVTVDPGETIAWRTRHAAALTVELLAVDGAEHIAVARPWNLPAVDLPGRHGARRTRNLTRRQEATRRLSAVVTVRHGEMAPTIIGPNGAALTAAYGRPVTPWTMSTRSIARAIERAGLSGAADTLAAVVRTSTYGRQVALSGATVTVTVGTVGRRAAVLVDDGAHGAMAATEWAKRAALAGVTAD